MNPVVPAALRIFIVDDSPIVRRGLAALLCEDRGRPALEIVGEAGTVAEGLAGIRALRPDLAVIDVRLPDGLGLAICQAIAVERLPVYSLVITSYPNDEYISDALAAGALGYVLKDADPTALLAAVRLCAAGRTALDRATIERVGRFEQAERQHVPSLAEKLSAQERRVLDLVAGGHTNASVGQVLGLSPHTVKNHLANIFAKLGVGNRAEAVAFVLRSDHEE